MLAAMMLGAALLGQSAEAPVRALIVTGVDHPAHEWWKTAPVLRELLRATGRVDARIVDDPEVLATELIFDYDVVVLHFRNEQPLRRDAQAQANLSRFVNDDGKGLVLVHFACGAFPESKSFGEVAGMVWDTVNTHDPRGPFEVRVVDASHPITKGLGPVLPTDDELYTGLAGRREVTLLAVARSKTTGEDEPMAFCFEAGKGRVFHTPLGHDVKALEQPVATALLQRGVLWTGRRDP